MKLRLLAAFALCAALHAWQGSESAFQVASVKRSPTDRSSSGAQMGPGQLSIKGLSARRLVMLAYDIPVRDSHRITGGPNWFDSELYDVDARSEKQSSQQEMTHMLRPLLTERWHLKLHRETRSMEAYLLVPAKGGPRFGPGEPGIPIQTFVERLKQFIVMDPVTHTVADTITVLPIIDQTGLTGTYNITFNANPGEDWNSALEHQLGLKFAQQKISVEVLVIDSIARPAEN